MSFIALPTILLHTILSGTTSPTSGNPQLCHLLHSRPSFSTPSCRALPRLLLVTPTVSFIALPTIHLHAILSGTASPTSGNPQLCHLLHSRPSFSTPSCRALPRLLLVTPNCVIYCTPDHPSPRHPVGHCLASPTSGNPQLCHLLHSRPSFSTPSCRALPHLLLVTPNCVIYCTPDHPCPRHPVGHCLAYFW